MRPEDANTPAPCRTQPILALLLPPHDFRGIPLRVLLPCVLLLTVELSEHPRPIESAPTEVHPHLTESIPHDHLEFRRLEADLEDDSPGDGLPAVLGRSVSEGDRLTSGS